MLRLKLKAGALQLTVFIIVVIALLLTGFILLVHTHKRFQVQTDFIIETTKNADKGIDYTLDHTIRLGDTTTLNLKDEDYKTLKVHRDYWGVFEKVMIESEIKYNRFQKIALIGGHQLYENRTALYVKDNNKPLVLVGNTKIEGVAYLPKRGVKPGTISGHSYYGSQLIYGQTKIASNLPKVFTETINHIKSIERQISSIHQDEFLSIEFGKSYRNSFLKPTQVILSNSDISLRSIQLTGHILVHSKTKISVAMTSTLKDVVLIAPEIEIKDHVKGNFQAIASKTIRIGKSVQLDYPSALVLNEKQELQQQETTNQNVEQHNIVVEDDSTIKGLVIYLGQDKPNNYNPQIELKEQATVVGALYCNQNTELKGSVYGTVYTNNFIAKQFGSVYQNHIYNGRINVNALPEAYIGIAFENSKKGVVKWLY